MRSILFQLLMLLALVSDARGMDPVTVTGATMITTTLANAAAAAAPETDAIVSQLESADIRIRSSLPHSSVASAAAGLVLGGVHSNAMHSGGTAPNLSRRIQRRPLREPAAVAEPVAPTVHATEPESVTVHAPESVTAPAPESVVKPPAVTAASQQATDPTDPQDPRPML